jgi:hypothetical protein
MRKTTDSNNKLFFVCPFCQMEHFIRKKYGDVYYVTAPAAIFSFSDENFAREIRSFLLHKNITDLYLVCDLECNFLNNVLSGGNLYGLFCEEVIENLVRSADDPFSLAEKMVHSQMKALTKVSCIAEVITGRKIKLYGMVTSKKENSLVPVAELV